MVGVWLFVNIARRGRATKRYGRSIELVRPASLVGWPLSRGGLGGASHNITAPPFRAQAPWVEKYKIMLCGTLLKQNEQVNYVH